MIVCVHYRVYDEAKCRHVWRIGATPCAVPPTDTHLPYLNSLGDTAIDFDIAPPRVVPATTDNTSAVITEISSLSMNVSVNTKFKIRDNNVSRTQQQTSYKL